MSSDFTAAVRTMLVPVAPEREETLLEFVRTYLDKLGVDEGDRANWLTLELRRWSQDGRPSVQFRGLFKACLHVPNSAHVTLMFTAESIAGEAKWSAIARRLANRYFNTHTALVARYLLDHDFARQLLAQSGWIARLAVLDRMSASEICRLVGARDLRLAQRWDVIQRILAGLGMVPTISTEDVQAVYAGDGEAEPKLLGDLDEAGSINFTAKAAESLGCGGDLTAWLTDLLITDLHDPYLLILHYQMIIQAYHDHPPTFAYEFKPRGQAVDWLAQRYRDSGIPVAGSAFLNNAKATLRFDNGWVAGRADHARGARAMAGILAAMEPVGGLARSEIASRVRALLRRHIRLREQANGALPHTIPQLTHAQLVVLFAIIAAGNTSTTGIAEQRLVDSFGVSRHPRGDGWSYRGIGDSVFAPNLPRRKFGDCEFERASQTDPRIMAYEAHGGRLSRPYVEDHLRTLAEILGQRSEDLTAIARLEDWVINVTFVSHGEIGELPRQAVIPTDNGVATVVLEYVSFKAVAEEFLAVSGASAIAQEFFTDRLNSEFVHPRVRQRVLEMLA